MLKYSLWMGSKNEHSIISTVRRNRLEEGKTVELIMKTFHPHQTQVSPRT